MRRKPMNGFYALRWEILERDDFTCQHCGQRAPNVKLEIDHIIPITDGGTDDSSNLVASCYACNRGKSGLAIRRKRSGQKRTAKAYIESAYKPNAYRREQLVKTIGEYPDGISIKELCRITNINRATMDTYLYRFTQQGFLTRKSKGIYIVEHTDNKYGKSI